MSSGSDGNSDFADSSGGNDQADSDGSRQQSNPDTSDDVEGHEPLGRCPYGHDTNRDCRCPCPECPNKRSGRIRPNRRGDRTLPPLTPLGVTRRIRREITHRIQESGYFRAEEDRVDHGGVEVPYHTETVGLPSHPPLRGNLRTNDRTTAAPLTNRLGVDGFSGVSARVGEFEGPENASEFPTNPEDHHILTVAIGQRPCTEMIPWISPVERWTDPCPRDRRILGNMDLREGNQRGPHWPCNQHNCQVEEGGEKIQRYNLNQEPLDESSGEDDDEDHDEDFKDDWRDYNVEGPPGDPHTHNGKRWVCSDHKEDAEEFWEHENLLQAHRVPTCKECNAEYQRRYPLGHNSCTCPNLLGRWQCRRCFEKKVRTVQTHFRQRVGALYTGEADFGMISSNSGSADLNRIDLGPGLGTYHWQQWATGWRQVRRMLIARHPCINPGLSHACGRKRVASYNPVVHCRSCGGVVVPPSVGTQVHRIGTRSRRQVEGRQAGARRGASPLQELTFPRRTRGTRGNRFGTARNINATTAAETDGTADVIAGPTAPGTGETETVTGVPAAPGTNGTSTVAAGPTAPGAGGTAGVNTVPEHPGQRRRPERPDCRQQ